MQTASFTAFPLTGEKKTCNDALVFVKRKHPAVLHLNSAVFNERSNVQHLISDRLNCAMFEFFAQNQMAVLFSHAAFEFDGFAVNIYFEVLDREIPA